MAVAEQTFHEANVWATPIRGLGLTVEGTRLKPILDQFRAELEARRLRVRPRFYLSTEWGVPFGTVAVAIPFYLARPELTDLHARHGGLVEGLDAADILRYLRHEVGHAVNYAYRLYETPEWVKLFGSITQPYEEEYRPEPWSRRFVRHLPGWYAQKHPDEDWAETFAVWMTPGLDWHAEYADWPAALAKLEYCDHTMAALADKDPLVTADDLDEDVSELGYSLEQYYRNQAIGSGDFPRALDGGLRTIFEDLGRLDGDKTAGRSQPAADLIRRVESVVSANVFRWTGHFPERTRLLLRHLADRADQLHLEYREARGEEAAVAFTTFVTSLALNHVRHGSYLP